MAITNIFTMEAVEIIEEAFEIVGAESRTGYDLQRAVRNINLTLQDWANKGINLWQVEERDHILVQDATSVQLLAGDIDVTDAVLLNTDTGVSYPMHRASRADYTSIRDPDLGGRPVEVYMERLLTPVCHYWPIMDADEPAYTLRLYIMTNINTVENPSDTVDIPSRFYPALIADLAYNIAKKIAPERAEFAYIGAKEAFDVAAREDTERGRTQDEQQVRRPMTDVAH